MKIPFAQVQGGIASVDAPPMRAPAAQADPSAGVAAFGMSRGLAAGAETIDKIRESNDRMQQARNSVDVANAITDGAVELDRTRGELDQDADHAGRAAKFKARADEVAAKALEKLTDQRAKDAFQVRWNSISRPMHLQVQQAAREEEIQVFKVNLGDRLDTLATQSVMARSDMERQALQAEAQTAIRDAVATGRMKATQAHTLQRAYLGKVDGALVSEMIRTNPGAAIAALGDPERFKYLDAAQRVQLRAQATNRAESLGAQSRAELRADLTLYTQARQAGQPVPDGVHQDLVRRSGGPGSALGRQIVVAKTFYDQVDANTQTQSLPQLRDNIAKLESGKDKSPAETMHDLSVARVVRRELTQVERRAQADFHAIDREYEAVRKSGEPFKRFADLVRMAGDIDSSGGLTATVREREQLYERLSTATGESASKIRERISAIDQLRDATGALDTVRVQERQALVAAHDRKRGELEKDPAAAALKYYPTIAETAVAADQDEQSGDAARQASAPDQRRDVWNGLVQAQRQEGVPEHKIALLTKTAADELRNRLLTSEGQGRVDLVEGLRNQYGDHWPRVKGQLAQGSALPPDIEVLAALPAGANLPKVLLAEAYKVTDKQASEVLGSKRVGEIDQAVRDQVQEMAPTMVSAPGGPAYLATFQGAAEKLARLYMMRGEGSAANAAKRAAADVFYDHWEVVGETVRVPKQQGVPIVPASGVRELQAAVIDALPKMELVVPAGAGSTSARKEALVRHVQSFGKWLTTADDKGMILTAGNGVPVMFADGQPLVVPFDSVLAMQGNRAAADNLAFRLQEALPIDQGAAPPSAGLPGWLSRALGSSRPQSPLSRNRQQRTGPQP